MKAGMSETTPFMTATEGMFGNNSARLRVAVFHSTVHIFLPRCRSHCYLRLELQLLYLPLQRGWQQQLVFLLLLLLLPATLCCSDVDSSTVLQGSSFYTAIVTLCIAATPNLLLCRVCCQLIWMGWRLLLHLLLV